MTLLMPLLRYLPTLPWFDVIYVRCLIDVAVAAFISPTLAVLLDTPYAYYTVPSE